MAFTEPDNPTLDRRRYRVFISYSREDGDLIDDVARIVESIGLTAARVESVVILGDWFYAESVTGESGRGWRQTIFSRYAPAILNRMDAFDEEFDELLSACGWSASQSRSNAIGLLQALVDEEHVTPP